MLLHNDSVRLQHIRDYSTTALKLADGKNLQDFATDVQLQLAVVRCVEIIGEAAARLSEEFRAAHPEIPWAKIINTRNRLAHAYFDINLKIIWSTVEVELPRLLSWLQTIPTH